MADRRLRVIVGLIICGAMACAACVIGCHSEDDDPKNTVATPSDRPKPSDLQGWIADLEKAFVDGGIDSFHESRKQMQENAASLRDEPGYDVAAMVLRLEGTPVTDKEADLAAQLRELAKAIEERPGQSSSEWERLRDKVHSYSFGNGPIDKASVPAKLVDLYGSIAGAAKASRASPSFSPRLPACLAARQAGAAMPCLRRRWDS